MYKKILTMTLIAAMLLTITGCKKEEKTEATAAATEIAVVETTETIPDIDREGIARETEPAVNKATIITGDEDTEKIEEDENTDDSKQENNKKPDPTEASAKPEDSTVKPTEKPSESTTPTTKPTESATEPTKPVETDPVPIAPATGETEYEKFMAMSGDEQKEFMYSFPSIDDFIIWLEEAEAEYKTLHPDIVIGNDGAVNAGDLVN